ncbi:hypothetical protein IST4116A_05621 [Burkholderia cenocepacia]|nr:hypothetical protein IST4112_05623 [Burkholderia cenocepacia]CAB5110717.1 hypothetical protein IST4113_05631 [Burkholderia cenocepacia]CAB5133348.1 hypothetical protein IST4134_05633 [Burkholderia cenocepacia]CAB5135648.1 hypothetical protein IST4129_05633 [Burkholderia cenocepacia]CAB5137278.1 hypothetical protein IST4116B_05616 [Burkholderia cenocepacia]
MATYDLYFVMLGLPQYSVPRSVSAGMSGMPKLSKKVTT